MLNVGLYSGASQRTSHQDQGPQDVREELTGHSLYSPQERQPSL